MRRPIAVLVVLLLLGSAAAPPASAVPPGSTPREIELGEEAADDIGKAVVLVDDPETLTKLQSMLDEIAAATERPDVRYVPHIIASPMINAFVVPGGWVYVTTGLLDAVQSDDELAGVMAHEIAHNVHQHAIRRMRNTPKGLGLLQLAAIAAVAGLAIAGSPEGAILANTAANTITAAVLNGHTVEAEVEADSSGIGYLTRTHYDPTGFLTFMERLASSSDRFFEEELGIYRTHPLTRDRVHSARDRLEALDIPIRRRMVTDAPVPDAVEIVVDGRPVTEIVYLGDRLVRIDGHDAVRARDLIRTIDWVLDHELGADAIRILPAVEAVVFRPQDGPAFVFTHADGEVDGDGEVELAGRLRDRLAGFVEDERVRVRANYQLY